MAERTKLKINAVYYADKKGRSLCSFGPLSLSLSLSDPP